MKLPLLTVVLWTAANSSIGVYGGSIQAQNRGEENKESLDSSGGLVEGTVMDGSVEVLDRHLKKKKEKIPKSSKDYTGPIEGMSKVKFDPNKQIEVQSIMDFSTMGSDPAIDKVTLAEVAGTLCAVATTFYTTKTNDSGDKIAMKFYPEDDVEESWALIVTCNEQLQELYAGDKTTLQFDTLEGMKLLIPDKQAILQAPVGNTTYTYGELMSTTDYFPPLPPSTEGDDNNSGGRKLGEGSIRSFGPYPGKKAGDWDMYQCVPMYRPAEDIFQPRSGVTILRGGNTKCEALWSRVNDGCSSPVGSDYWWSFTPACQRHDICYSLSYHYDPVWRPQTRESREQCDTRFKWDMHDACKVNHCRYPWQWAWECPGCFVNADIWWEAVKIAQGSSPMKALTNWYDASASSLKQIWRPWDWRQPADVSFAESFLATKGRIKSMMSSKAIMAPFKSISALEMAWPDGSRWNEQEFVRPNPQSLAIKHAHSDYCLDVYGFAGAGGQVVMYPCNGATNQQWWFDDIQRLHPVHRAGEDLCLDIQYGSYAVGAKLIIWNCHGGANQQWFWED